AGLFFAWEVSVIVGLKKVSNRSFVEVMWHINRRIQNPAFLTVFMGCALLLPLCTYWNFDPEDSASYWLLASALCYLLGVMAVTIFGNVPLNNQLDRTDPENADESTLLKARQAYERPWNRFNRIRTIFAILSLVCLLVAILA
ncbi:MAG: DUF1772 domain-containing protein, partial [Saprospiraceae bacterium]|nr:DUF1772 domain-containing protein [Saprospiraceae bacterium]